MKSDDIASLASQLELASRRTRPFVAVGVLAMILGFVFLSLYLESQNRRLLQQEEQEMTLRQLAEQRQVTAENRLAVAQQLLKALQALQRGDQTGHTLTTAIAQAKALSSPTASQSLKSSPSIYFFVRTEDQRKAMIGKCSDQLQALGYNVLGVELVTHGPQHDEVKVFHQADQDAGAKLAGQVAYCGLNVPENNVVWITDDPSSANSPRFYFEIWLATPYPTMQ